MITLAKFRTISEEDIVMVETGTIEAGTMLKDLEDWDSMALVSLNACLDEHYGFTLKSDELNTLEVFGDIIEFIEKKK